METPVWCHLGNSEKKKKKSPYMLTAGVIAMILHLHLAESLDVEPADSGV